MKTTHQTALNRRIASLTAELANAQFRSGVIERRIEQLEREGERYKGDRRPRFVLLYSNNRRAVDSLLVQRAETYDTITRAFLELEEARSFLRLDKVREATAMPHAQPRRSTERAPSGLYRMGRIHHKELP